MWVYEWQRQESEKIPATERQAHIDRWHQDFIDNIINKKNV